MLAVGGFLHLCFAPALARSIPVTERAWARKLHFLQNKNIIETMFRHLLRENFVKFLRDHYFRQFYVFAI